MERNFSLCTCEFPFTCYKSSCQMISIECKASMLLPDSGGACEEVEQILMFCSGIEYQVKACRDISVQIISGSITSV